MVSGAWQTSEVRSLKKAGSGFASGRDPGPGRVGGNPMAFARPCAQSNRGQRIDGAHHKCVLQLSLNAVSVCSVNDSLNQCAAPESCTHGDLCPLNEVKAGTAVRIKQLMAAPEVSHRLREMGFCEEQQVKLVSRQVNVICQVCQARVGLSTELAESILVETLPRKLRVA